jgi:hypothetical protein
VSKLDKVKQLLGLSSDVGREDMSQHHREIVEEVVQGEE